jgi:hypothetical protein
MNLPQKVSVFVCAALAAAQKRADINLTVALSIE